MNKRARKELEDGIFKNTMEYAKNTGRFFIQQTKKYRVLVMMKSRQKSALVRFEDWASPTWIICRHLLSRMQQRSNKMIIEPRSDDDTLLFRFCLWYSCTLDICFDSNEALSVNAIGRRAE
jgi:hypothetical protein